MEPSRELDKLVAEALGWTDFRSRHDASDWWGIAPKGSGNLLVHRRVPAFSTSWADAGEALNWLVDLDCDVRMGRSFYSDNCWAVIRRKIEVDFVKTVDRDGETIPHALALAVVEAHKNGLLWNRAMGMTVWTCSTKGHNHWSLEEAEHCNEVERLKARIRQLKAEKGSN